MIQSNEVAMGKVDIETFNQIVKAVALKPEAKRFIAKFQQMMLEHPELTESDLNDYIDKCKLPLGFHCWFTGRFSDIMAINWQR